MKKPIVAGNWKMNLTPSEAEVYFLDFTSRISRGQCEHFMFFPPAVDLFVARQHLSDIQVLWGAQNIHKKVSGAFTGEISATMLKDLGGKVCLVGHSERRTLFGETDQDIAEKVQLLQSLDITPLICVGESLVQRNSGITQDVIADQIVKSLGLLDSKKPFILAYEPVWAIGTGKVATPDLAEGAHVYIRYLLEKKINHQVASSTPILYGGSVTPENAKDLIKQKNIDGFLVGGASLKVDTFLSIFNECQTVSN